MEKFGRPQTNSRQSVNSWRQRSLGPAGWSAMGADPASAARAAGSCRRPIRQPQKWQASSCCGWRAWTVEVASGIDLGTLHGEHLLGRTLGRRLEDSTNRIRFGPLYGSCYNANHSHGPRRATVEGSSRPGAGPQSGNSSAAGSGLQSKCDLNRPVCYLEYCACAGLSWVGAITRNHDR